MRDLFRVPRKTSISMTVEVMEYLAPHTPDACASPGIKKANT